MLFLKLYEVLYFLIARKRRNYLDLKIKLKLFTEEYYDVKMYIWQQC